MKVLEEDIQGLSRAILRDATAEAEQLKEEAQAKADEIRKRAQEQAEKERQAILERAKQEAERLRGQVVATAQLKARTTQLEHREKLMDKVFEAARQRIPSLQKRSDYAKLSAELLREALIQLNASDAQVRADEATMKFLKKEADDIAKELNAKITFGDPLESGTGVLVDTSDGRLHYDNTLETRLNRFQSVLRSSVYQVLMGEKL
jgi:V/A-type H+-transporting ATPase subunit E